jgi:hypothetical protein
MCKRWIKYVAPCPCSSLHHFTNWPLRTYKNPGFSLHDGPSWLLELTLIGFKVALVLLSQPGRTTKLKTNVGVNNLIIQWFYQGTTSQYWVFKRTLVYWSTQEARQKLAKTLAYALKTWVVHMKLEWRRWRIHGCDLSKSWPLDWLYSPSSIEIGDMTGWWDHPKRSSLAKSMVEDCRYLVPPHWLNQISGDLIQ